MADDVIIGSGATTPLDVTVAADEIAAKKHQRVKISVGDEGTAADVGPSNPLPVSDNGSTLSIDDGGGSITVDGAISVTGTMPVDSSKVEDAAHASGDTGAFVLAVRNDAGTALAGTTGDYIPLSTDSSGNLRTTGGGGGTQFAEDAAHVSGDLGTMALAVRKDTATALSGTDGDYTPLITDASGRQHVNVGVLPALPAGTNAIGKLSANSGVDIGDVDVTSLPALATGTNVIGKVQQSPATSGGYSVSRLLAAASTNATSVKGSAGQVFGWYLQNTAAYPVYFKIYNKASSPTVGSDTPVLTIGVPAGAAANVEFLGGIALGTGIAFATTKLVADADTTVLVANDLIVNLLYA